MRFNLNDEVLVRSGFYKGMKGTVYHYDKIFFYVSYQVDLLEPLGNDNVRPIRVWIASRHLEKVKQ